MYKSSNVLLFSIGKVSGGLGFGIFFSSVDVIVEVVVGAGVVGAGVVVVDDGVEDEDSKVDEGNSSRTTVLLDDAGVEAVVLVVAVVVVAVEVEVIVVVVKGVVVDVEVIASVVYSSRGLGVTVRME